MRFNEWRETELGLIPMDWDIKTIGEIGRVIGGGTPNTKIANYWDGNISWITPKDLSGYNERYIYKGERSITKEGLENSSTRLLPKGTVLFSSRAPIGYVAIAGKDLTTNQGFKSIICNDKISYNLFVYYLMIYKKEQIEQIANGSTFKEVSGKVLSEFKVTLPPLNEQKAIAKILSDLDEKIEINNRINKVLEEMAQAIFKRWFVDFEFPNENGEPYKSSGGEMVESELGPIPKGWEVKTLEEITSKFTTGLNPRRNFVLGRGNNYYVTIKNMGNQTIILDDRCDKIDDEAIQKINKRSDLRKGDILFSAIGTIGRTYLIDETPRNWNISESIFTLRASNEKLIEFLYLLMLSVELQTYSKQLASGSVQKGIRMSDLKKYKFAISFDLAINDFRNTILPIIKQYKRNQNENKILAQLRDTLLPKLMSGEIRVPLD